MLAPADRSVLIDDPTSAAAVAAFTDAYEQAIAIVAPRMLLAIQSQGALAAAAGDSQFISDDEWEQLVFDNMEDPIGDSVLDGVVAGATQFGQLATASGLARAFTSAVKGLLGFAGQLRKNLGQWLTNTVGTGVTGDWGIGELTDALMTNSPLDKNKAMIAADLQGANNGGLFAAMQVAPPTAIRWVTMRDERVRPAHVAVDTETVLWGQKFRVGGHECSYPGDPTLPPALRINCRCVLAYIDGTDARRVTGSTVAQLRAKATTLGVKGGSKMNKAQLQTALLKEMCLQGLAGGPDCPDVFDQLNRNTLLTYARQEGIVGRYRMSRGELVYNLRQTIRGGDTALLGQGYSTKAEFSAAQKKASYKKGHAPGQHSEFSAGSMPTVGQRRSLRGALFDEFGGNVEGHVPCVHCGLKLGATADSGLAVLVPEPIVPWSQGGSLTLGNLVPACPSCFRASGGTGLISSATFGYETVPRAADGKWTDGASSTVLLSKKDAWDQAMAEIASFADDEALHEMRHTEGARAKETTAAITAVVDAGGRPAADAQAAHNALYEYTSSGHARLNRRLQGRDVSGWHTDDDDSEDDYGNYVYGDDDIAAARDKEMASDLDYAIATFGTPSPPDLTRGKTDLNKSRMLELDYEVGDTFTDKAFGSWSANPKKAGDFARVNGPFSSTVEAQKSVVMRMVNSDTVRSIPGDRGEAESIIPRNTSYRVVAIKDLVGGDLHVRFIDVEAIDPLTASAGEVARDWHGRWTDTGGSTGGGTRIPLPQSQTFDSDDEAREAFTEALYKIGGHRPIDEQAAEDERQTVFDRKMYGDGRRAMLDDYIDVGYDRINKGLKDAQAGQPVDLDVADAVSELDSVIADLGTPSTPNLLRGKGAASRLRELDWPNGHTFTDPNYGSWTSDVSTARNFTNMSADGKFVETPGPKSVVMRLVNAPTVNSIPGEPSEQESVLPRGVKYRVVGYSDFFGPEGDDIDVEPAHYRIMDVEAIGAEPAAIKTALTSSAAFGYEEVPRDPDGKWTDGPGALGKTIPEQRTGKPPKEWFASKAEFRAAKKLAQHKAEVNPQPSKEQIAKNRKVLDKAKKGGRPGGELRGNSYTRRARAEALFAEFGGDKRGHVPCVHCGIKVSPSGRGGHASMTQDKILVAAEGGSYGTPKNFPNIVPSCQGCNASRNDAHWALAASAGEPSVGGVKVGSPVEAKPLYWEDDTEDSGPTRRGWLTMRDVTTDYGGYRQWLVDGEVIDPDTIVALDSLTASAEFGWIDNVKRDWHGRWTDAAGGDAEERPVPGSTTPEGGVIGDDGVETRVFDDLDKAAYKMSKEVQASVPADTAMIDDAYDKQFHQSREGLTDQQDGALAGYTTDGFVRVNRRLQGRDVTDLVDTVNGQTAAEAAATDRYIIDGLDSAIAEHGAPIKTTLLRGKSGEESRLLEMKWKVGDEITEPGFGSWTERSRTAEFFADSRHQNQSAVIRLVDANGARALPGKRSEVEWITQRGITYKVRRIIDFTSAMSKNKHRLIDVEVVPASLTASAPAPEQQTGVVVVATVADPQRYTVEGGLPAEELHVTLGYYGDADELSDELKSALTAFVHDSRFASHEAHVGGVGLLGNDDPQAVVMFLESDELQQARDDLEQVALPDQTHPHFTPHMTVGYGVELPDDTPDTVELDGVELWWAGEKIGREDSATASPTTVAEFGYEEVPRDDDGRWTSTGGGSVHPIITAAEARGDSRPVTFDEFQEFARRGQEQLDAFTDNASPTTGLDDNWDRIKADSYAEVTKPWGGATIDAHTGDALPQGANVWAITVKAKGGATVSVPETATEAEFNEAMDQARQVFGDTLQRQQHYLGVFHDDDNQRIDIDPVLIVTRREDVDTIGAASRSIGGAYNFADGNGYWPPHVRETS